MKRHIYHALTFPLKYFLQKANRASVLLYQDLNPVYKISTRYGPLHIFCPNELILWRANTFFTKEPDTIAWIDSLPIHQTMWDIGANIGLYSLYAANRGMRVLSFEPESQNFAMLNRNILLNQLSFIDAFGIAVARTTSFTSLYINKLEPGYALHRLGDKEKLSGFMQKIQAFSIDDLVLNWGLTPPNHIKIDTDGFEPNILRGAAKTLESDKVKSILIEVDETDPAQADWIKGYLGGFGFTLKNRHHEPMFDSSPHKNIYNYVFSKNT